MFASSSQGLTVVSVAAVWPVHAAFCLPLDIISQVVINSIFFCIHMPPTVTQIAYAVNMLVRHKPILVKLQWNLERVLHKLLWHLPAHAATKAAADQATPGAFGSTSNSTAMASCPATLAHPQECLDPSAYMFLPPQPAPDLITPAGRLVLTLSLCLMLYLVLYVPLLFAWRLERHLKSRFMLTVTQAATHSQTANVINSSSSGDGSSPSYADKVATACAANTSASCSKSVTTCRDHYGSDKLGKCDRSSEKCGVSPVNMSDGFVRPPKVFALLPPTGPLVRHLLVAAVVCFALSEGYVWLCIWWPAAASILWEQII